MYQSASNTQREKLHAFLTHDTSFVSARGIENKSSETISQVSSGADQDASDVNRY